VAVRARETIGATETSPRRLKVGEQAVWVDTGDPMPTGFDAVIMVEVVHQVDESTLEIQAPVAPYQHVRPLGEDIVATELVLPASHLLRPQDLAACAAAGLTGVAVRQPPHVTVIPTGSELVPIGTEPRPGDIIEFNSLMLGAMIAEWGGRATRWPAIPDDFERLKQTILEALVTSDIVVVNAGSSAGSEDYTARAVADLGQLVVHGVAVRPGHPVVLGVVSQKPVIGIPGYPVSAALTCELFVKPLIEQQLGLPPRSRAKITAHISRKVLSPMGEDEYLRVRLGQVGEKMVATPMQRGAGVIMSLVRADGLVTIPRFSEGVDAGQEVVVELLCSPESLAGTIVAIGSHDLTLDLLASELRRAHPRLTLASSNVGSLGGLLALQRGEAHVAGSHLLDEATGEYNLAFIRRYVKDCSVVVVNLVHRIQGFIVPPGNPKGITTLADLARASMTFVNRQRGSGTRVLLDYLLKQQSILPTQIAGYEREEFTHLAVAAAVAGGRVDVGLGVLSAARALGMDFVPLQSEQYDLVIPREFYQSDLLQPLLTLIRSTAFQQQVEALGGYNVATMGEVVAEFP
jgi:putative molybdopterin biosynthesis protein